jgi:hypothetical protein
VQRLAVNQRTARPLWLSLTALSGAVVTATAVLLVANRGVQNASVYLFYALIAVIVLAYAATGALLTSRRPENVIGWIFCIVGVTFSLTALGEQYALHGLVAAPGSLPGVRYVLWVADVAPRTPSTTSGWRVGASSG